MKRDWDCVVRELCDRASETIGTLLCFKVRWLNAVCSGKKFTAKMLIGYIFARYGLLPVYKTENVICYELNKVRREICYA